ncbi:hypothetical protein IZU89_04905 [Cellulophaga lytica]|uniref:Uncharacterized protein n=1 Tax=Cellulophaga lytica (strain ATCC 23178 / DSM 7489 / JCM 8516 / NBRC 14961 / NCIMB 1423 / VKM B-1433 / Cy l20) TaxID=867900 RepID=F0RDP0_CELLC|nr:hypothetical protein [Cellulophaga lytica]ADY28788.1 hypothetical protein Celly_0957 [Cellulophaga lytica DSM 7489]APU09700.1 hypothetical protein A5M85_05205 [Cellulophaga lytica]WQG77033.1 hypothetical protein SR888_15235 [Cellulophaga lytica]SNQ43510.1 conserved hypothetical protein [Cellulophaga lytica]
MSKSEKKTKIRGITTAKSEKENKQDANRKYRRIVKQKVKSNESELPKVREISNVWSFDKDGKKYDSEMTDKDLRK